MSRITQRQLDAARAWAAGTESQVVVAERFGVPSGSMSRVVKMLGLRKERATVAQARRINQAKQAKLDAAMRAETLRIIDAHNRRRASSGGVPWDMRRWG